MINPTENRLTSSQVTEAGALDPEVNTSESYPPEMTAKNTLLGDAEWLSSKGFILVVSKRSTGFKKNKLIDKS
ncbi:22108_t:CDS:2 [Gigaspora margarita]|uniref:22108_t:CDS:1 n=1 Tax=Gigaspora margarita TaxID=4874 RepID=A0ABN7VXQ7_GIGMA|nr:22108_t:CDS:2 [Gigaspora margarita]